MQFNGKLMNKTWKKSKQTNFVTNFSPFSPIPPQMDPDLGPLGPNSDYHDFFYKTSS